MPWTRLREHRVEPAPCVGSHNRGLRLQDSELSVDVARHQVQPLTLRALCFQTPPFGGGTGLEAHSGPRSLGKPG